jgi:hypothetical protein
MKTLYKSDRVHIQAHDSENKILVEYTGEFLYTFIGSIEAIDRMEEGQSPQLLMLELTHAMSRKEEIPCNCARCKLDRAAGKQPNPLHS